MKNGFRSIITTVFLCLISFLLLFTLSSCGSFTENGEGNIVSPSGAEYVRIANEGVLNYLGNLVYLGSVKGESFLPRGDEYTYSPGIYSIEEALDDNILVRILPDSEWYGIYRKASLSEIDFSVENCSRLEYVSGYKLPEAAAEHAECGDGISDKNDITAFLSDVRGREDPRTAGLYDSVTKPDGMMENCYVCGVIYGFFEDESYLCLRMNVMSFNDRAYSVSIGDEEYVLPDEWLTKFQIN